MSFAKAIQFVLQEEGGLVNDPNDPGGLSNYGIALNRHPELTAEDIRTMSPQRATAIYFDKYWNKISGQSLPAGVDLVMLDISVNLGPEAAISCLQHALNTTADGEIGRQTLKAAAAADPHQLVIRVTAERVDRYTRMAGWEHDGRGWVNRSLRAAIQGVSGL